MTNEWLKIKVIRDIKNIKRNQKLSGMSLYTIRDKYSITSKFTKEYRNLIELINNSLIKCDNTNISESYLNSIDFDLFTEVSKLNNVTIIDQPSFIYGSMKNNNIITHQSSVISYEGDQLNHIKHSNNSIYLYQIEKNYARFKEMSDNKFFKINIKNKLNNLRINDSLI